MTAYNADEAIERLEAAICCEHLDCVQAKRERDTARAIAVRLEAEQAVLRVLLQGLSLKPEKHYPAKWMYEAADEAYDLALEFVNGGVLPDGAFALAQRIRALQEPRS